MISSSSNQQIKYLNQVKNKPKLRRDEGVFLAEGTKMVREAGKNIIKIYVTETYLREAEKGTILETHDIETVSDKIFREITDTKTPQGILALVKQPQYNLDDFLCQDRASLLLLEDLRDPGNLGTIMRTAEGAGMTGVILSRDSVDLFNPKTVRSTMGSIYRMPFYYADDFYELVKKLKKNGITIYATHLAGEKEYHKEQYGSKCGIIMGNESKGITERAAGLADILVRIPMEGRLESLNASVAAALMMYEVYRRNYK